MSIIYSKKVIALLTGNCLGVGAMKNPDIIPLTEEEKNRLLAEVYAEIEESIPTPAEIDEMARLDAARKYNPRTPHEL